MAKTPTADKAPTKQELTQSQRITLLEQTNAAALTQIATLTALLGGKFNIESKQNRTLRRQHEHVLRMSQAEFDLSIGEKQFLVQIPGEDRSRRLVGAPDRPNAQDKFMRHFGITAFLDHTKVPLISDVQGNLPLEEWPKIQLKAVREADTSREIIDSLPPISV